MLVMLSHKMGYIDAHTQICKNIIVNMHNFYSSHSFAQNIVIKFCSDNGNKIVVGNKIVIYCYICIHLGLICRSGTVNPLCALSIQQAPAKPISIGRRDLFGDFPPNSACREGFLLEFELFHIPRNVGRRPRYLSLGT